MLGSAYGGEQMAIDGVTTVVDAAVAYATAGVGNAVLRSALARLSETGVLRTVVNSPAGRYVITEGVEAVVGGVPSAAVEVAADDATWRDTNPGNRIVRALGTSIAMDMVMSGGMDIGGGLLGRALPGARATDGPAGAGPHASDVDTDVDGPSELPPAPATDADVEGHTPLTDAAAERGRPLTPDEIADVDPDAIDTTARPDADADADTDAPHDRADVDGDADADTTHMRPDDVPSRQRHGEDGGTPDVEAGGHPRTDVDPDADTAAVPEVDPLDDLAARAGMPRDVFDTLASVAELMGMRIQFRPTTSSAPGNLAAGMRAKPEVIKAKTINGIDRLLHPDIALDGSDHGRVGFFEPTHPRDLPAGDPRRAVYESADPTMRAAIDDRFASRRAEWTNPAYRRPFDEGLARSDGPFVEIRTEQPAVDPDTGLPTGEGAFAPLTGDHDLFDIRWADGRSMTRDEYTAVINMLRGMGLNVEHGALTHWPVDSPDTFSRAAYDRMMEEARTSEPVIEFSPEGARQTPADAAIPEPMGPQHGPEVPETVPEGGYEDWADVASDMASPPRTTTDGAGSQPGSPAATTSTSQAAADALPALEPVIGGPDASLQGGPTLRQFTDRLRSVIGMTAPGAPPERRMLMLRVLMNQTLEEVGVPGPRVFDLVDGNGGATTNSWRFEVGRECFEPGNESWLAEVLYHEARHLEQRFRLAQMKAQEGWDAERIAREMRIPRSVADAAVARQADIPPAMRPLLPELWASLYGDRAMDRRQMLREGAALRAHARGLREQLELLRARLLAVQQAERLRAMEHGAERDAMLDAIGRHQRRLADLERRYGSDGGLTAEMLEDLQTAGLSLEAAIDAMSAHHDNLIPAIRWYYQRYRGLAEEVDAFAIGEAAGAEYRRGSP